jgi:hypothetical protein
MRRNLKRLRGFFSVLTLHLSVSASNTQVQEPITYRNPVLLLLEGLWHWKPATRVCARTWQPSSTV